MSKPNTPLNNSQWIAEIYNRSEIFSDLKLVLDGQNTSNTKLLDWPTCQQLMSYMKADLCSLSGSPIRMESQDENLLYPEMSYEERIYKKGIISTREKNWHDFFNAMIWGLFPQTKKQLNLLHIKEIEQQSTSHRTRVRDTITHLDESGVIIVSSNQSLLDGLKNHQWLEVFYHQRRLWHNSISAYIFGHGMYEKALNPFLGFTGKMYPVLVEENFFKLDRVSQYQQLDKLLSGDIDKTNSMKTNQSLTPLPILGVPGWYEDNKQESFYFNTDYFRPAKTYPK